MPHTSFLRALILLPIVLVACVAGTSLDFQPGDRWAVLGDSITHSGTYHCEVELFHLTRRPFQPLDVINCGIAGDSASGALLRLDWDCLVARPTVVSVMLGMNDVGRDLYAPGRTGPEVEKLRAAFAATFARNLRALVARIKTSGSRVILITPSPFDDTVRLERVNAPGCGAALAGLAVTIKTIAEETNSMFVDFNTPLTTWNLARQKTAPESTLIGPDRIHPGAVGHFLMAYLFLHSQHISGLVSSIDIDSARRKLVAADNARVSGLVVMPDHVAFTAQEDALPFPVSTATADALDLVPFTNELNRQILRVTNLARGTYQLVIDDKPCGRFRADELAIGVNLAVLPSTPQLEQARVVRTALRKKWDAVGKLRTIAFVEHTTWPDASHPLALAQMQARLETRQVAAAGNPWILGQLSRYSELKPRETELCEAVADAEGEARRSSMPRSHIYVLSRVPELPPAGLGD